MRRDEYVTVTAILKAKTDKAVLLEVSDDSSGWIPRSCLHFVSDRVVQISSVGDEIEVQVMEWTANEKGLIWARL